MDVVFNHMLHFTIAHILVCPYFANGADVTITILDTLRGTIRSNGQVKVNTTIHIKCRHPVKSLYSRNIYSGVGIASYTTTFSTKQSVSADSSTDTQVSCIEKGNQLNTFKDNATITNIQDTECTTTYLGVKLTVTVRNPPVYQCSVSNRGYIRQLNEKASQLITIFNNPTDLIITQNQGDNSYREGDVMLYSCYSTGRPPPELQFTSDDFNISVGDISHDPPLTLLKDLHIEKTSVITWSGIADREMNKKYLKCTIRNHPSNRTDATAKQLSIYYGNAKITVSSERKLPQFLATGKLPIVITAGMVLLIGLVCLTVIMCQRTARESSHTSLEQSPNYKLEGKRLSRRESLTQPSAASSGPNKNYSMQLNHRPKRHHSLPTRRRHGSTADFSLKSKHAHAGVDHKHLGRHQV